MGIRVLLTSAFVVMAASSAPVSAQQVTASLPDYNGTETAGPFPLNLGTVGTFTFTPLTGDTITSAYLEGTYGTAALPFSTASFNASVNGTSVTVCAISATCTNYNATRRPFSIALPSSVFASLLGGSASLGITQTADGIVRYGTPTLRINYVTGGVPEPATWAMMLLGFGGIGLTVRRKRAGALATA